MRIAEHNIVVSSLYGFRTQRAIVQLSCPESDFTIQLQPSEARDIAMNLVETASAAEFDAAVVGWLREDLGLKDDQLVADALTKLRPRVEAQIKKGWPDRHGE